MKKFIKITILATFFLFICMLLVEPALASDKPVVDYFYNKGCHSCVVYIEKDGSIWKILQSYNESIVFNLKQYNDPQYKDEYNSYITNYSSKVHSYPFLVIKSENNFTVLPKINMTFKDISMVIDAYLNHTNPNVSYDDVVAFDFLGWKIRINASAFSLPVLTIVLGGLDSFNPCAFFILIFLLNLLLYARSRRRMILIGGVFIFFSGLWYYFFMFVLYNTLLLTGGVVDFLTIVLGLIVVVLGAINIKDFFFFKKGASLSIPDEKKPGLFKRMRDLVKNPEIAAVILGTVVLAATVNFYELICTSGFPIVFTNQLRASNLSMLDSYLYIFFYNVVYVIPLIVIVSIFVFTLGRWKLSEWHGRVLKLLSGVMLVSFGTLFVVKFSLLQNVITPILLLVFSVLATLVISYIWKKYSDKKEAM